MRIHKGFANSQPKRQLRTSEFGREQRSMTTELGTKSSRRTFADEQSTREQRNYETANLNASSVQRLRNSERKVHGEHSTPKNRKEGKSSPTTSERKRKKHKGKLPDQEATESDTSSSPSSPGETKLEAELMNTRIAFDKANQERIRITAELAQHHRDFHEALSGKAVEIDQLRDALEVSGRQTQSMETELSRLHNLTTLQSAEIIQNQLAAGRMTSEFAQLKQQFLIRESEASAEITDLERQVRHVEGREHAARSEFEQVKLQFLNRDDAAFAKITDLERLIQEKSATRRRFEQQAQVAQQRTAELEQLLANGMQETQRFTEIEKARTARIATLEQRLKDVAVERRHHEHLEHMATARISHLELRLNEHSAARKRYERQELEASEKTTTLQQRLKDSESDRKSVVEKQQATMKQVADLERRLNEASVTRRRMEDSAKKTAHSLDALRERLKEAETSLHMSSAKWREAQELLDLKDKQLQLQSAGWKTDATRLHAERETQNAELRRQIGETRTAYDQERNMLLEKYNARKQEAIKSRDEVARQQRELSEQATERDMLLEKYNARKQEAIKSRDEVARQQRELSEQAASLKQAMLDIAHRSSERRRIEHEHTAAMQKLRVSLDAREAVAAKNKAEANSMYDLILKKLKPRSKDVIQATVNSKRSKTMINKRKRRRRTSEIDTAEVTKPILSEAPGRTTVAHRHWVAGVGGERHTSNFESAQEDGVVHRNVRFSPFASETDDTISTSSTSQSSHTSSTTSTAPSASSSASSSSALTSSSRSDSKKRLELTGEEAVSAKQRLRHVRILRLMSTAPSPDAAGLIKHFEKVRRQRDWKWSTCLTQVGTLLGAVKSPFANAPAYLKTAVESKRFAQYVKSLRNRAVSEPVNFPKAATPKVQIIEAAPSAELRSIIIIMWATAARFADVMKLQTFNINLAGEVLMVRWVKGKGVSARQQAFTTASTFLHVQTLREHIARRLWSSRSWSLSEEEARQALKRLWTPRGFFLSLRTGRNLETQSAFLLN